LALVTTTRVDAVRFAADGTTLVEVLRRVAELLGVLVETAVRARTA